MSQADPKPSLSSARKFGIGLALVALPVAAAVTVWQLKQDQDKNNDELERGFTYDDSALRQIDAKLIGYSEVGKFSAGMTRPTCMGMGPDGRIYVAGDRLVKVLDAQGVETLSFPIEGEATCIAVGPAGDIYIGMGVYVRVHYADGKPKASWASMGTGSHIGSIAVGENRVYVADSGSRVGHVVVFDLDGNRTGELAKENAKAGIPGIITPSAHMDVAVSADGNIWVANPGRHQIEQYSPTGELLKSFGQSGTAIEQFLGCCNPSNFALLSDGRIVTAEKGVPRVKVYRDDGHLASVVAGPDSFGGNRQGINLATDTRGRVLVLEPGTPDIRIFAEKK